MSQHTMPPPSGAPVAVTTSPAALPDRLPPAPTGARVTPRWVIAGAGAAFGVVIAIGTALPWARYSVDGATSVVYGRDVAPDDVRIVLWCAGAIAVAFALTALTRSASFLVLALGATFIAGAMAVNHLELVLRDQPPYQRLDSQPHLGTGLIVLVAGCVLALLAAFYAGAEYRRIGQARRAER